MLSKYSCSIQHQYNLPARTYHYLQSQQAHAQTLSDKPCRKLHMTRLKFLAITSDKHNRDLHSADCKLKLHWRKSSLATVYFITAMQRGVPV